MKLALALSCLLAGCMSYADLPPDDPRRLSVPEQHDREYRERRAAEERAQAERDRAAEQERLAELEWRAAHPSEARQVDALRGIEDAIRDGRRTRCTSSTHLGQTYTSCR